MFNDTQITAILQAIDNKRPVADIAAEFKASLSSVYKVLREHRPDRKRTRRRTSTVRGKVVGLLTEFGYSPTRVAFLCGISPAYVYRIQAELGHD